jgi:hypothetical protein
VEPLFTLVARDHRLRFIIVECLTRAEEFLPAHGVQNRSDVAGRIGILQLVGWLRRRVVDDGHVSIVPDDHRKPVSDCAMLVDGSSGGIVDSGQEDLVADAGFLLADLDLLAIGVLGDEVPVSGDRVDPFPEVSVRCSLLLDA